MSKRYRIVIEETGIETVICGKQWKPVCEGGEYAYTPEIEKKQDVTRVIYTQDTDSLDLIKVIKAVNGIDNV